ncbi:MAG: bifunctional oligoribonuclease/PAP phosphatase NrnA [Herpetosiphonaceae bacterium]|nr:bifunctional oligoribonuclease/PAP phosphatase NrnA [Herpetosiphonaceae bacterium]
MMYTTVADAAAPLRQIIAGKHHILVISHVNPDGDAIGSVVGLGLALEQQGHQTTWLVPTPVPPFATRMPGAERVQSYSQDQRLPATVDLVILVDTGDVQRITSIWEEQQTYLRARPLIVIDHHVTNSGEGLCNLVDPLSSSTCELIYGLLRAWDVEFTPELATALLFGITTDTQSFRTSNTTPSALRAAADLLEQYADREAIVRDVYHNTPFTYGKLLALALAEMQRAGDVVWTHVSQEMQRITGADDEAGSEVTDYLAGLGEFKASALFKERRDGTVKVSFRSNPPVDVASVAQQWGGGGHRQAAGCTIMQPLSDAEPLVIAALLQAVEGAQR